MFKKLLLPIILLPALISSCNNDDESTNSNVVTTNISFTALNGNQTYLKSDTVNFFDTYKLRFDDLEYFVSNITLIDVDGKSTYLDSVQFIDHSKTDNSFQVNVEKGTYSKITFNLGLTEDLNQSDPTKRPVDHPLSTKENMFWSWGSQYRFVRLQGNFGEIPTADLTETFAWHPGTPDLLRKVELDLEEKEILSHSEINIELQVTDILNKIETVDVKNNPNWHGSPSNVSVAHKIVDNFVASLSYKK